MNFIWILLFLAFIWWVFGRKKFHQPEENRDYTEEETISFQVEFEKKLNEEKDMPGSVNYSRLYIYNNLMRKWFEELSSKYRYDEKMVQKIRNDWMEYMLSISKLSTATYLYVESDKEEEKNHYESLARNTGKKIKVIEDSFAAYIGDGAILEMDKTRNIDSGRFSRGGKLAPKGKRFGLGSEELMDE